MTPSAMAQTTSASIFDFENGERVVEHRIDALAPPTAINPRPGTGPDFIAAAVLKKAVFGLIRNLTA